LAWSNPWARAAKPRLIAGKRRGREEADSGEKSLEFEIELGSWPTVALETGFDDAGLVVLGALACEGRERFHGNGVPQLSWPTWFGTHGPYESLVVGKRFCLVLVPGSP
jgi:hypothetical protein